MVDRSRRYTPEEFERVLEAVRQGSCLHSLPRDLPLHPTLYRWMRRRPELRAAYDAACAERAAHSRALGVDDPGRCGRPTDYGPEVCELICALVMEGRSLRRIAELEAMPSLQSIFNWFTAHPDFRRAYEAACQMRAELAGDDTVEMAEQALDPETWPRRPDGTPVTASEALAAAKLKINAHLGRARLAAPKRFGASGTSDGELTHEEWLERLK